MLATISAHPHANVLTSSDRNPDNVFETVDFRLLTACPACTLRGRVGSRNRTKLVDRLQRGNSQETTAIPPPPVRAGKFRRAGVILDATGAAANWAKFVPEKLRHCVPPAEPSIACPKFPNFGKTD